MNCVCCSFAGSVGLVGFMSSVDSIVSFDSVGSVGSIDSVSAISVWCFPSKTTSFFLRVGALQTCSSSGRAKLCLQEANSPPCTQLPALLGRGGGGGGGERWGGGAGGWVGGLPVWAPPRSSRSSFNGLTQPARVSENPALYLLPWTAACFSGAALAPSLITSSYCGEGRLHQEPPDCCFKPGLHRSVCRKHTGTSEPCGKGDCVLVLPLSM